MIAIISDIDYCRQEVDLEVHMDGTVDEIKSVSAVYMNGEDVLPSRPDGICGSAYAVGMVKGRKVLMVSP